MDTLSHGLWALAIFWGTSYRWWAFLIGMLPDLLSFGIYLPTRIIEHGFMLGRPDLTSLPAWLYTSYSVTHSFFTWAAVGIILYLLGKKYWPVVFAAMAHIALDIPTHATYFPTPFLWPFSTYHWSGISWGTPWVFAFNWICLAIVYTLIGIHEWQKRHPGRNSSPRRRTPGKLKKR